MKIFFTLSLSVLLTLTAIAQNNNAATLPYMQDFESTTFLPNGWEEFGSNTNAAWEHSTTVGAYGKSTGSAFFDNFTTDLTGNYYGMRAIELDLTNATKPMMKFDVAYARKNATNSDRLGIWYSFNGTTGWMNLMNFQNSDLTTAPDQTTLFTPSNSEWDSITIDLSQFAGESLIRMAFENNCSFGNVIYIDNVRFYDADAISTGIERSTSNTAVNVYPNPSKNGIIKIEAPTSSLNNIHVFNTMGQELYNGNISQQSDGVYVLNIKNEAPGLYHLIITDDNGKTATKKILFE